MLEQLLGDTSLDTFFSLAWNKRAFKISPDSSIVPNFTIEDFFHVIDTSNLSFPQLTCMNEHGQVPHQDYLDISPTYVGSRVVAEKVKAIAREGNTIRIRSIGQFVPEIESLRAALMKVFSFNVTINAYYSTSPANGINPHYDIRHIFVLQLFGEKEWHIGKKIDETPRHEFRPFFNQKNYEPLEKTILKSGEILYIPPGLWHQTHTQAPNNSLHLAIGITLPDWYDFMLGYMEYLMKKYPLIRSHIPFKVKDGICNFEEYYINEHRNLIELLKNDMAKYNWRNFTEAKVNEKP